MIPTPEHSRPGFTWPIGHLAWIFDGEAEFESRVAGFLADGLARGERLLFVADDPGPGRWPPDLVDEGRLIIASTAEIYGEDRVVDATSQRGVFAATLADALAEGFTGIRVAADNTSLLAGDEGVEAWIGWERVADEFMSENPVTGLCAFDRLRSDETLLRRLAAMHPHAVEPTSG